jgi:hypothetical protein
VMRMRYKLLGRTGLRISELCLGAMIFGDRRGGWGASRDEAARIAERFAEAGFGPLQEVFWGNRHGEIFDPFGHRWALAQRLRDVPADEIRAAAAAMFGGDPM